MYKRQAHNELYRLLAEYGIDMEGITYGIINGETYGPRKEHDGLCRKPDNRMAYGAPIYILETDEHVIKLPDMGIYRSPVDYADAIDEIVEKVSEQSNN